MSLVIDSSVTLAWYFEAETTDASLAILDRVVTDGAASYELAASQMLEEKQDWGSRAVPPKPPVILKNNP